jgi:hypothetical protein
MIISSIQIYPLTTGCLVPLKILHVPFMFAGGGEGFEGAEIAALAGFGIFLARIQAITAGWKFADHFNPLMRIKIINRYA